MPAANPPILRAAGELPDQSRLMRSRRRGTRLVASQRHEGGHIPDSISVPTKTHASVAEAEGGGDPPSFLISA